MGAAAHCHSRDRYDSHHWGYTPEYLEQLMAEWGFVPLWTKRDYIVHVYPSFQTCFGVADAADRRWSA